MQLAETVESESTETTAPDEIQDINSVVTEKEDSELKRNGLKLHLKRG